MALTKISTAMWNAVPHHLSHDFNVDDVLFVDVSENKVGIGTISPSNTLHIYKNATIGAITSTTTANAGLRIQDSGANMYFDGNSIILDNTGYLTTNGAHNFVLGTNNTARIHIDSGGNIGIGTTSPSGKLHIAPDANSNYVFTGTSTSGYSLNFDINDIGADIGINSSSRSLNLQTNSTDRLTIAGNGPVTATVDMRAPIFYDSNDTTYYINPAGTSIQNFIKIYSSVPQLAIEDSNNGGGGGASGLITFRNIGGRAIGIGYTSNETSNSDLIISTNAASTYGGYLGLDAAAISDAQADIILDPKTDVRVYGNITLSDGSPEVTFETGATHYNWQLAAQENVNAAFDISVGSADGDASNDTFTNVFTVYQASSGYTLSSGSSRAPIFYDSNNTNWYVNPASTSTTDPSGKFAQYVQIGDSATYNSNDGTWGARLNVTDNVHARIDVAQDANSMRSTWYAHTGQSGPLFGSMTAHPMRMMYNGSEVGYWDSARIQHSSSVRGPIFYDSNNTNYYVNPASTSSLLGIHMNNTNITNVNHITINDPGVGEGIQWLSGNDWRIYESPDNMTNAAGNLQFTNGTTARFTIDTSGNAYSTSSLRAPIFYDSNNTGYYIDPYSTSNLNNLRAININGQDMWEGTITVNGDAATYYPVGWYGGSQAEVCEIEIFRNYSETAPSSWNTSTHKGGLVCKLRANFGGWGGVSYDWILEEFRETYSTMVAWAGHLANGRAFGLRLRGGGAIYHVRIKGRSVGPTITYGTWDPGNNSSGIGASTSVDSTLLGRKNHVRGNYLYSYGEQVAHLGSTAQTKSGTLQSNTDFRAPTFYDSNNTNFYGNFNAVGDSIRAAGDIVAYYSSDRRLKDNIIKIDSALDKVNAIGGYTFEWNDISHKETGKKDVGVIAQEVEEIFPEIVQTRSNGYKAVNYEKLVPLLIEAVKELSEKVKMLENK